jgi:hypothetical protein
VHGRDLLLSAELARAVEKGVTNDGTDSFHAIERKGTTREKQGKTGDRKQEKEGEKGEMRERTGHACEGGKPGGFVILALRLRSG